MIIIASNIAGESRIESVELARLIVDLIADKKGEDIVLLDVHEKTIITDYFIICNGSSERQLKAIVEGITETIKKDHGIRVHHVEGDPARGWVLIDYTDVVVHIFAPEYREFYDLENLWQVPVLLKMQ